MGIRIAQGKKALQKAILRGESISFQLEKNILKWDNMNGSFIQGFQNIYSWKNLVETNEAIEQIICLAENRA